MTTYYAIAGSGSGTGIQTNPWQHYSEFTGLKYNDVVYCSGKFRETLTPVDGVTYKQWPGMPTWITDGSDVFSSWTGPDGNGEYYTPASADPKVVFMDDVKLTEGTVGSLASGEWGWDSGNSRIYVKDDPSGKTVEAGVRGYCIAVTSIGYTVSGAQLQKSRAYGIYMRPLTGNTQKLENTKIYDVGGRAVFAAQYSPNYGNIELLNVECERGYKGICLYKPGGGITTVTGCSAKYFSSTDIEVYQATGGAVTFTGNHVRSLFKLDGIAGGAITIDGVTANYGGYGELNITNQTGGTISASRFITSSPSPYGIYVTGQSGGTVILDGNEVSGAGSYGIYLKNVTGGTLKPQRNKVHGGSHSGIRITSCDGSVANIVVANNSIYDGPAGGFYGIEHLGTTTGVKVYRNTIKDYGGMVAFWSTANSAIVKANNLVSVHGVGFHFSSGISVTGLDEDYNNCLVDAKSKWKGRWVDGTEYTTLSSWQAATSQDANSISSDPCFVDASADNFALKDTSPCRDRAPTLFGAPSTDILGNDANQGAGPDIGAYEYCTDDKYLESGVGRINGGSPIATM